MAVRDFSCETCGATFQASRSDARFCRKCRDERNSRSFESRHRGACPDCGAVIVRRVGFCRKCASKYRTSNQKGLGNGNWKGGRTVDANGYVLLRTASPTKRHPYELEHRVLWERAYGPLPKWHIIHHLNGVKADNRLENLAAMSRADHHTKHAEPYEARIRALEARIRELEGTP